MDVVKNAVEHVNPAQTPVVTLDQPLFALAKQIQWKWPEKYGEDNMVVMFGGLHIEMAALRLPRRERPLLPASCPRHPHEKSSPNHCNNTAHTTTPCVYTPLYDRFWWCGRPAWVRILVSPESERHPPLSALGNCAGTRDAGTGLRGFTATGFIRDVPCCPDGTGATVPGSRPHTLCQVDPCSPEGHGSTPNEAPRCSQGIWGWQLHCTEDVEHVLFYPNRPGAWTERLIDQMRILALLS